jgi:hypothetical protein
MRSSKMDDKDKKQGSNSELNEKHKIPSKYADNISKRRYWPSKVHKMQSQFRGWLSGNRDKRTGERIEAKIRT